MNIDYRKQEKVVMDYMRDEFYIPATQAGGLPQEFIEKEQLINEKLKQENDLENARIAKLREEYFDNEKRSLEKQLLDEKMRREEELLQIAQEVDDYITENRSDPSKDFITSDNLQSAIENAIEYPVSFEFYIDRSGRKNGGRIKRQS